MKKFKDEIWNLEGCLAELCNQNQLIDLLIYNGFDKLEFDLIDMKCEYKRNQALLFTIQNVLRNIEETMRNSIDSMYEKDGEEEEK